MKQKLIDFDLNDYDLQNLPYSETLEMFVLGCIMINPDCYNAGYKYLKPKGLFYDEHNAAIWAAMGQMVKDKTPPNRDNIMAYISYLKDVVLNAKVNVCYGEATNEAFFLNHCLKLNEYWIKRTITRMGHYLNQNALKEDVDALDLLGIASDSVGKIYLHIASMKEKGLNEGAQELVKDVVSMHDNPGSILGVRSSLSGINRVVRGYRKGNLIVIASSTSEGKSTLAFQEIIFQAEMGIPVGVILLEMTIPDFMLVAACNALSFDIGMVMDGRLSSEQIKRLGEQIEHIKKLPIKINDTPAQRIGEIMAIGRSWRKHNSIQALYVDHMHLIPKELHHNNQEQQFTDIANKLKELGKELNIPVIALAQLARKEISEKRPHIITDIKYAGGIEQAADVVLLIFRPEHHGIMTDQDGNSTEGQAKIIIGKLRLIKKEHIRLRFTGLRFEDYDAFKKEDIPPDNPRAGIVRDFTTVKKWTDEPFR